MLNIALPKGRLGDKVFSLLAAVGYSCAGLNGGSRKLVFEDAKLGLRYFLVKPSDVGVYVEHGAADIGVAGKDVLLETEAGVYELLDLGLGQCRLAVAAPNGFAFDRDAVLRVATKYPHVAKEYFRAKNCSIDIINLHGSIELAPILGLSHVIVDIVETGTTLKENNLSVLETIAESSARLIANKSSYKFKGTEIDTMVKRLSEELKK